MPHPRAACHRLVQRVSQARMCRNFSPGALQPHESVLLPGRHCEARIYALPLFTGAAHPGMSLPTRFRMGAVHGFGLR